MVGMEGKLLTFKFTIGFVGHDIWQKNGKVVKPQKCIKNLADNITSKAMDPTVCI